jgi:hypothetical protein
MAMAAAAVTAPAMEASDCRGAVFGQLSNLLKGTMPEGTSPGDGQKEETEEGEK